jgi:nitrate reductase NapE component
MKLSKNMIVALSLVIFITVSWFAMGNWFSTSPTTEPELEPGEQSVEVTDREVLLTMLWPYVDIAIAGHYGTENRYAVQTAPYVIDIVRIEQPDRMKDYAYDVTVVVEPYANAHITIGEDTMTFEISLTGIRLKTYLHNKDYPLPEYMQ